METTVKQRLIHFIKHKSLTQKRFEEMLGLSNGYVNNIRKSISNNVLLRLCAQFPEINRDWLLYGEGEMLKASIKKPMGNVELLGEVREIIEEETVPVKFFELNPTAGFSMQYFLSEEVSTINIIPSHGERLGDDYCAFKVKGESMAPQIQSNALILCQEIPPTRWYSIGEAVVVIVYEKEGESYGVLKRIKDNRLNDHNYLLLSSDNPEYPHTEKVALAEIRCIFRAVRVLSQRIY